MKSLADLSILKLALRGRLCVECSERPADDIPAPPAAAGCEKDCTLFLNLSRLARVAGGGEPPCGYEVYAKSLQAFPDKAGRPDVVQALKILETTGSDASGTNPDSSTH